MGFRHRVTALWLSVLGVVSIPAMGESRGAASAATDREPAPFARFTAAGEQHSWANTYLLALASEALYAGREENITDNTVDDFRAPFAALGLEVVAFLDSQELNTDTQAVVARNDSIALVVFNGSDFDDTTAALRDWLKTDARISPIQVGEVKVHRGFFRAFQAISEQLKAALAEPLRDGFSLWFTGHSLGGALANLAAYLLSDEGIAVAGVTTFASPKVGDVAFVADFEQRLGTRSQQWTTALDPIPRLPEITRARAYARLGPTNVVFASGVAELDTKQRLSRIPNPLEHRMLAYTNYLYRALPEKLRQALPLPPPLCVTGSRQVELHPDTGFPICLSVRRRVGRSRCLEVGGEVFESWCVEEEPGKYRHRARRLRKKESGSGADADGSGL